MRALIVRPLLFVAVAATASWGALAACNVSVAPVESVPEHPTVDAAYDPSVVDGGSADDAASGSSGYGDASTPNLCHLSSSTICDPDDPATSTGCRVAPDGGTYDPTAGTGQAPMSCHVAPSPNDTSAATPPTPNLCLPAGSGMDGATCKQSADCAPRYECVGQGPSGEGACRRYCCAGDTACSAQQFCDVQAMAASSATMVPVCMPIAPTGGCDLLADGGCASMPMQTCAVVSETGATSCVDVGPVKAGGDCDEQHCAANLVCLGAPGQRACYTLCHTSTMPSECPSSKPTCKGGLPLFPDPDVGICQ